MARGLTELDVHDAADDIVSQGERPTVERIRAHLGTGSPNTVTRHLDTWWSSIGARLQHRARERSRPDVPAAVEALAQRCWVAALESATEHALAVVAGERADLTNAQASLAAERDAVAQEMAQQTLALTAAAQHAATAAATESALREQVRVLTEQVEDLRNQRDGAYARNDRLDAQLAALRGELEAQQVQHTAERDELHAHLRASEDRSLAEVDRARQALKKSQHCAADQARQHERERASLIQARQQAEQSAADAVRELGIQAALAHAYASQLERLGDLPEQVRAALAARAASAKSKARRKAPAG